MRWFRPRDVYYLVVLSLIKATAAVPARLREKLVDTVGLAAYFFSRHKRQEMYLNMCHAFGESMSASERRATVRCAFLETWREIFSILPARGRAGREVAEVAGLEHLQEALARGKGVILWESVGFGRRYAARRALHELGHAIVQVHGPDHLCGMLDVGAPATRLRSMIRRVCDRWEMAAVAEIVDLPASKSLAFARILNDRLRQNEIIFITGDGVEGYKHVEHEFLGVRKQFATGIASLARIGGVTILPVFCSVDSPRVSVTIEQPVVVGTSGDRETDIREALTDYAVRLERRIRLQPGLYRNWHLLGADDRR